jgi:hypothetical protein
MKSEHIAIIIIVIMLGLSVIWLVGGLLMFLIAAISLIIAFAVIHELASKIKNYLYNCDVE